MLYKEALGNTMRETRKAMGVTLRDVATKSFTSLAFLSEVERGRKEIASQFLESYAKALGVETHELVIGAGMRMAGWQVPETPKELFDEYHDLMVK